MKKGLLVGLVIAALVGITVLAERPWEKGETGAGTASTPAGITLIDLGGKELDLGAYKGKVVLVNFWATWCQPCRIEMPWMIEFQEKYGPRNFTVLGVAMDDEGRSVVEPFLQKERYEVNGRQMAVNYPILIGNEKVGEQFDLFGLPTSLVISRDGKLVKKFIGLVNHELLVKEIEGQL